MSYIDLKSLPKRGCERLYQEKISGADSTRSELATMLDYVRENDVFVVCKLDRLARSTKYLLELVEVGV